jgi:PAS domain S-box-containing protein
MDDAKGNRRFGFLEGGDELGRLIAAFDWAATPLGPIEGWPSGLRAVLATALRAPGPIALFLGPEGIFLYNDPYRSIAGPRHPDVLGRPVAEAWPEVADFNAEVIRAVLAGGTVSYRDRELTLRRNGVDEQVWLDLDYWPLADDAGRPSGVIVHVSETTEKVKQDRAAAGQRERFRLMFEQAPSFMAMLLGPEHVFDLANAAYLQLIGHRDVIGKPVREALPDIAGQGYYELLDRVFATGEPFVGTGHTVVIERAPGLEPEERILDFLYTAVRGAQDEIVGVFVQGIDTTERLAAERALRASEAQFRTFARSMPIQVWAARPDGSLDWFNPRVFEYAGAAPGELEGEGWTAALHPDDRPEALRRWTASIASGRPFEAEFRVRRADGAWRRHVSRAELIRDEAGRPLRWIGTNTDIENQTRIEQELRDSELRLRLSQAAAGIASLEVDVPTGRVFGSDTLWSLWGLPPAESVPASTLEELVVAEDRGIRSSEATRREGSAAPSVEYRIRRADTGALRWIARDVEFVRDAAGRAVKMFGVMRDVTDAKEAEARQQLLTHELEHRIKNILATVSAIASQTLRDTDLESARAALNQRLQALAGAHDVLNRTRWTSASLPAVIAAAIEPFPADRIEAGGPDFVIGPRRALALALAVNELGTNALKYGALSADGGKVTIGWALERGDGAPMLVWRWSERGGPAVTPPARRGFGRFLLERVLAADFGGTVGIDFRPDGVRCVLAAPWAPVEARPEAPVEARPEAPVEARGRTEEAQ